MQLVCEIDGNPLERGATRFCSIDCRSEGRRRATLATRPICEHPDCANPVKMPGRRFCSQKCAGKAMQDRHPCGNPSCSKQIRLQRQFCSRGCEKAVHGTRLLTLVCCNPTCPRKGEPFERYASTVRNPERVYCSGTCRAAGRVYPRGRAHPQWKGGTFVLPSTGYRYIQDPSGERRLGGSGNAKPRSQHVVIAEMILGRRLLNGEHMHHVNGDKLDNRPANLLLLNASQHRRLHAHFAYQYQREHAAKGDLMAITGSFLNSGG